jgi:hypothetical protein
VQAFFSVKERVVKARVDEDILSFERGMKVQ